MNKVLIIILSVVVVVFGYLTFNNYNTANKLKATLNAVSIELIKSESNLKLKQEELTKTQLELSNKQILLDNKSSEFNLLSVNFNNLQTNYNRMTLGYGYMLKDPTYQEMKQFITNDNTDKNKYTKDVYDCQNFASDVINNAIKLKIRCAYVSLNYKDMGHAIIAFNTTDKGLIYVEPQYDKEVQVIIGKSFSDINGFVPQYTDIVLHYIVIW